MSIDVCSNMKYFLCFLLILFTANCFSQEYCTKNFSLKSNNIAEMRDTVTPKFFLTLETSIDRKIDTITFTFIEQGKIREIKQFVIQHKN